MPDTTGTVAATFAELKEALENTDETLVYLSSDIYGESGGILIPNTKPNVTIDGFYDGVKHRYHDYSSSTTGYGLQTDTIRVYLPANGTFVVTMQNMYIDSVNYYGPMSSPLGNANYNNVTYIMRNVTYHGPQVAYIAYGGVEYYDSEFFVDGETFSTSEEFAECNRVTFGGNITINHNPRGAQNMFPFTGSADTRAITIKEGSNVIITTTRIFFSGGTTPFTIEDNGSLYIQSSTTLSPASIYAAPFAIGENASFTYIQTARNGTTSTVYCNGDFIVSKSAKVYMEAQYSNTNTLIRFVGTSCRLSITDPESFVLRSPEAGVVRFSTSSRLELQGGQINYWSSPASSTDPGGWTDIPTYPWRKTALDDDPAEAAYINGNTTNTVFTLDTDGTNLTAEELVGKPLENLLLYSAYVFAIGNIPLSMDVITNDNHPIEGVTAPTANVEVTYTVEGTEYKLTGAADSNGDFSIATTVAVPLTEKVTIRVNTPFLISSYTQNVVEVGDISMENPPDTILFAVRKTVSQDPVLFGRNEDDWSFLVKDTRARKTPWYIYVTIDEDLTGENGHTLPRALVFRGEGDALEVLSDQPVQVWSSDTQETSVTVGWDQDRGLLMQRSEHSMHINERYSTTVFWELETD